MSSPRGTVLMWIQANPGVTPRTILVAGLLAVLAAVAPATAAAAPAEAASAYLGQPAPGATPEIFAPGLVSLPDEHEFGSVFAADGLELFYGVDVGGRSEIRHTRFSDGAWTAPRVLIADQRFSFNDPFLSPDEQRLYFISDRPPGDDSDEKKDYDIWYVERTAGGWGRPINAGVPVNSKADEYYVSFTREGTLVFASNRDAADPPGHDFDLYAAVPGDAGYLPPKRLPGGVNTRAYEGDPFIAYDGSYVIFGSSRRSGFGRGDLYVSFRNEDGTWSAARNMGRPINGAGHQLCPFVTRDGRAFFFTSDGDVYWVDAAVIDSLR